jgi:hypothetical protein
LYSVRDVLEAVTLAPGISPVGAGWSDGRSFRSRWRDYVLFAFFFFSLSLLPREIKKKKKKKSFFFLLFGLLLPLPTTGVCMLCLRCLSWGWQMRTEKMSKKDSLLLILVVVVVVVGHFGSTKPKLADMICCLSFALFSLFHFQFHATRNHPKRRRVKLASL